MHPVPRAPIAAAAALLCAACAADGDAGRDAFTVRDSAGIRIAESSGPAWQAGEEWRLSDEPILEVGMLDGPPAYQFAIIVGAARTRDGGVVVADEQAKEVRWFGPDGRHLRTAGREGSGPGEFKTLDGLARLRGDTVALNDWRNARITAFDPEGTFAGDAPMPWEPSTGIPRLSGALDDGSLLFVQSPAFTPGSETGLVRNPGKVSRVARPANESIVVAQTLGADMFVTAMGDGISVTSLPFGRASYLAATGDGFWIGNSDSYEIVRHAADGTPTLAVRRAAPSRAVSAEALTRQIEDRTSWITDDARRSEQVRALRAMPLPNAVPAFSDLKSSTDGFLWVREYDVEADAPPAWSVFEPEGRLLGTVTTPPGFRVHEIGPDYVLGVWRDDLDVPFVRVYALEKPAR